MLEELGAGRPSMKTRFLDLHLPGQEGSWGGAATDGWLEAGTMDSFRLQRVGWVGDLVF